MHQYFVLKEGNDLILPLHLAAAYCQLPTSFPIHPLTVTSYVLRVHFTVLHLQPVPGVFGDKEIHIPEASLCMSCKLAPSSHIAPVYLGKVCVVRRDAIG